MGAILIAVGAIWLVSLVLVLAMCKAAKAGDDAIRLSLRAPVATTASRPRVIRPHRAPDDRPARPAARRLRILA